LENGQLENGQFEYRHLENDIWKMTLGKWKTFNMAWSRGSV